jgi:hypothetical protein
VRQIHCLDGPRGTSLGPIQGQTHHQDGQVIHPRRRRAVQARRVGRLAAMRAHPSGRELLRDLHAGVCGHHAAPRTLVGNAFRQGFYWPLRLLMPVRSCAPARGATFTPARLTFLRTPSRRSPSHGPLPCGGWTLSGPSERRPRATPTCWLPSTSFPSGRGAPDHKSQGRVGRDVLHQHHLPVRGA